MTVETLRLTKPKQIHGIGLCEPSLTIKLSHLKMNHLTESDQKVTRGQNIDADGRAGACNPQP